MARGPGTQTNAAEERRDDPSVELRDLDDIEDREELRRRYEVLLQELRVALPGAQVLLAFLLTAPFATGFDQLDSFGRDLFGVALLSSLGAVVALLSPTMFHRVGDRNQRKLRLAWGIRMTLAGAVLLGISLCCATYCIARVVFGGVAAWITAAAVAMFVGAWVVLPRVATRRDARP